MHPEEWNDEVQDFLVEGHRRSPFDYAEIEYVRNVRRSKQLNHQFSPAIIISASGMAESGRILHHLKNNIENPANTILAVSFMAQHTLGRRIKDGEPKVRIFGEEYEVNAHVESIEGYSAHADQRELLSWASHFDRERLRHLYLVHGEPDAAETLATKLRETRLMRVEIPELHQTYDF